MDTTHKKKILYVITKSNFGGAQRYVYELAVRLPKAEYEVHVACGGNGILTQKLGNAGITVHTIKNFERDINLSKEFGALIELYRLMRSVKPDLVHVNSSKAGGSGALAARLSQVKKIIFTAHGWPFFEERSHAARSFIWLLSYLTVLLAHTTVVVSQYDKQRARMPFVSHKLTHIYTGVPPISYKERMVARTSLFDAATIKHHLDDIWAVATSEHTKNKNLTLLIDALAEHNRTSPRPMFLTLIGEGEETELLKMRAKEKNVSTHICFTGFVDEARMYLHAFDLFVLPSLKEGLPYGLLEAGSAGLFPIASTVGGIPEVITHGTEGILIDPHRITSLVRAFTEYANNQNQMEYLRAAFHKKITANFGLETMVQKTTALYQ